ncbi:hypothetical protein FRC04_001785 [Tulasnella sp. 424]|nr:hypothetical protein FRC04_001785 [Tulasnella sp. 424]
MLDLPALREVIWIGPNGPTSGSTLLHRSAQCIKASPGLLLDWDKRSRTLDIKSNYERRSDIFTPDDASMVILSIRNLENLSGLMKQVARLLNESSSVRFETNSKRAAKRARKFFKRSRGVFEFHISY